ncbi:MAG: ABC transporter permease, partial [Pseudomonadota bacterium]
MTAVTDPSISDDAAREERRARLFTRINKADTYFSVLGMSWVTPVMRAAAGDNPQSQMKEIWRLLGVPIVAIICFLMLWAWTAPQV